MDAYGEDLAYIHDAGFGNTARDAAELLIGVLQRDGVEAGAVVELGCGSGILSEKMATAGYDVTGVDISPAFVELARRRVPGGRFFVGSLLTVELPPCVAVAAVGECVNYLFDDGNSAEALADLFARVYQALMPGGLFLFDTAEPGRVVGQEPVKTHIEGEDWAVLVTVEEDRLQRMLRRDITSFRKVGESYRRSREVHRLRLYPRAELEQRLVDIGFHVSLLNDYGGKPFPAGYVGFLARKPVAC